jgi:hypothetical protein
MEAGSEGITLERRYRCPSNLGNDPDVLRVLLEDYPECRNVRDLGSVIGLKHGLVFKSENCYRLSRGEPFVLTGGEKPYI